MQVKDLIKTLSTLEQDAEISLSFPYAAFVITHDGTEEEEEEYIEELLNVFKRYNEILLPKEELHKENMTVGLEVHSQNKEIPPKLLML